jgi:soluble lytic murein transglycosylase-like protein
MVTRLRLTFKSLIGSRRCVRRVGRWARFVAASACLLGALAPVAHADVWVRLDEAGVGHFARERLDDRYVLYYRAPVAKPVDSAAQAAPAQDRPPALEEYSPKLAAFFQSSQRYRKIKPVLTEAARSYDIDVELLQALIAAESAFNADAVSEKGAIGLMQVMPDTARRFGIDSDQWLSIETKLANPRINVHIGSRYLRLLLNMFPGRLDLALASYNAGEGAVIKAGNAIPNYKETQDYVAMVTELYGVLKPPPLPQAPLASKPAKRHYAPGVALSAPLDAYTLVLPKASAMVVNPGAVAPPHSSPSVD